MGGPGVVNAKNVFGKEKLLYLSENILNKHKYCLKQDNKHFNNYSGENGR